MKLRECTWNHPPPNLPRSPPENVVSRSDKAADLDLIGTSAPNQWVEFAPCCRSSGTLAWPKPPDLIPKPTAEFAGQCLSPVVAYADHSSTIGLLTEAMTSVGPATWTIQKGSGIKGAGKIGGWPLLGQDHITIQGNLNVVYCWKKYLYNTIDYTWNKIHLVESKLWEKNKLAPLMTSESAKALYTQWSTSWNVLTIIIYLSKFPFQSTLWFTSSG